MTTAIRSGRPRVSTCGLAPVFSATIRFWISVDSLNRPPTLLTIASSFRSSSIITAPLEQPGDQLAQLGRRPGQVVVHDLILILPGAGEFGPRRRQPPADRRLVL